MAPTVSIQLVLSLRVAKVSFVDSSSGMDYWAAQDLICLSDKAYAQLAEMLMAIENGASWPDDLIRTKLAHLAGDPKHSHDPLACRVLMLMLVLYRRWIATRLRHLRPCIKEWAFSSMFVGAQDLSAGEARYYTPPSVGAC